MVAYLFAAFFLLSLPSHARILGEYLRVNPHALPGDTEYNHLPLPGVMMHESNDWYGNTDKLISGTGTLNITGIWRHLSTSVGMKGRFITPILQTRNDQDYLPEKIGVFADSMETSWHNSITLYGKESMAFKLDFGAAYTDIGNHGLVNLYQQIHDRIGSPTKDEAFGPRLRDSFIVSTYGVSFVFPLLDTINMMIGGSAYDSVPFHEKSVQYSFVFSNGRNFAASFKFMYVFQERSEWYELTGNRRQYMGGLRLFSFWTPSFMYVSPYVEGDKFGQVYFSPISFTWPF